MWGKAIGFFAGNWKQLGSIVAVVAVAGSAYMYHLDAVADSFRDGRTEAIGECNATQLQKELEFEQAKNKGLAAELARREEIAEEVVKEVEERVVYRDRVIETIKEVAVENEGKCEEAVGETSKAFMRALQERQETQND